MIFDVCYKQNKIHALYLGVKHHMSENYIQMDQLLLASINFDQRVGVGETVEGAKTEHFTE